jgi:hypothetical protein
VVVESSFGPPSAGFCLQKKGQFGWGDDITVVYDKDSVFDALNFGGNFHLVTDESLTVDFVKGYPSINQVKNAIESTLGL